MSEEINAHPTDHTHEDINGYCAIYLFRRDMLLSDREIQDFARRLMIEVSMECLKRGAHDVGHIKAHLEYGKGGFLYADTLGDVSDTMIRGREGGDSNSLKLVINSIIVELEPSLIRDATEEAVDRLCTEYGFSKEILEQDLYDADGHDHNQVLPEI